MLQPKTTEHEYLIGLFNDTPPKNSIKVAVQPCQVRASSKSNEALSEYLTDYKLDYMCRKPQDYVTQVCDNEIHNLAFVWNSHTSKYLGNGIPTEPNKKQKIPHALAFAATYDIG